LRGARLAGALLVGALLAGCGASPPDLFVVRRSGPAPGAALNLLVNDGGFVHCNGGPALMLPGPLLLQARYIQTHIHDPAQAGLTLPPGAQPVFHYALRDVDGHVSFSDDSRGQPAVFFRLQLLVLEIAQQVCHVAR
jgi:hypothetical protein